jgi:hypothetical protein
VIRSSTALSRILTLSVVSVMAFSSTVYAGGGVDNMPGVQREVSPLDQVLFDTKGTADDAPIPVTAEPEQAVEPVIAEPEVVAPAEVAPPAPENREVAVQPNSAYLGLSVGLYDAVTHGMKDAAFGLELQPGFKIAGILQPIFGGFMTSQNTWMGYGGVGLPFNVTKKIRIMPSIAAGYYDEGDGYDLQKSLAFRGGAEVAYIFDNQSRLGLNAHVITNGTSMSNEDRTEVISLVYSMPLGQNFLGGRLSGKDTGTAAAPSLINQLNQ